MRYFPLYEAKMFHQFDHRWATYSGLEDGRFECLDVEEDPELTNLETYETSEPDLEDEEGGEAEPGKTRDCTLLEKQDPSFLPTPRYWVSEADVLLRAVPLSREEKKELEKLSGEEVVRRLRPRAPKWLIALRDITNTTNERTAIFSALPLVGCGNKAPLFRGNFDGPSTLTFLALVNSVAYDFANRCKLGGTTMNWFYAAQMPCLAPSEVPIDLRSRIVPVALELVYTSEHLRPLAEACGYDGDPFPYDEDRRAVLRGELDALVARLYGLSRKQLRYLLDPHGLSWAELENLLDPAEDPTCSGPHLLPAEPALDFPGETFRVLKDKEEKKYGEYRTRRLVLEAWDRLWDELGPVEPLPVRFGPNAPNTPETVQESRATYGAVESALGRLFDTPVATGLFASESAAPPPPSAPAPRQQTQIAPTVPPPSAFDYEDEDEEEDDGEAFTLVAPEPKPPTPLKDKQGNIIRVRVLSASGQEIVAAGTVVGSKKQGQAVEWAVLVDETNAVRKFLSPPATLKRLQGGD